MKIQNDLQETRMDAYKSLAFENKYFYPLVMGAVFIASCIVFEISGIFHAWFDKIMSVVTYLSWHSLFEFVGALVSFSAFIVPYYTHEPDKRLSPLFIGSVFLTSGIIDIFHALSFKGMPEFIVENHTANRATTLWILSRLIIAFGMLLAAYMNPYRKVSIHKSTFLVGALVISLASLIIVTYFPDLLPVMYEEGTGITNSKKSLEYFIIVLFVITMVKYIISYHRTRDGLNMLLSIALLLHIFAEYAFTSYYRVYDIYNYLGHIYKVIASFLVFKVLFVHNVQKPYRELNRAQDELKAYAENLDRLVEERTKELKQVNGKLLQDLEYARDIQKAMLPVSLPRENEVCFDARYFPAERVSGDFYNIFKLDEHHIGIYIGDVSGHGVPAAMLTVFLNQSVKMINDEDPEKLKVISPANVLKNIYKSFNKTNFGEDTYLVMLYGIYNTKTREFVYSSAGMNVPPLIMKAGGQIEEMRIKGFPICKFIEYYTGEYTDSTIKLAKGEKIFFYTDGVTEAENVNGERYKDTRLKQVLSKNIHNMESALLEEITSSVFDFIGSQELKDDITFFIMEIK